MSVRVRLAQPSPSPGPGAITAAVRAFSLTSLVAQRDAEIEDGRSGAAVSSCALVVWATAAGSAMAFPGMAAFRVPACWMIRG